MNHKVLIAGAGPVGLTLALELTRYGVPVSIVEKITQRETTSRAVAVWSRTLELLDRAGAAQDLLALGNRVSAANILAGSQTVAHIDLRSVASPYAFALMIPQDRTETVLAQHLASRGVSPQLGVELVDVAQDAQGVTATLQERNGASCSQHFDWLVACDGAHSVVRHKLGLTFEGETLDTLWVQGDFLLKGFPFTSHEIATYWHEEGVLIFFPMTPDRFRVIASMGHGSADTTPAPPMEVFQQLISRRGPGGITLEKALWISKFQVNERQVERYRAGRIFLAGDAAHVHSPAGGQGMNTGMQDAVNLAWKLAMVCRGVSSSEQLLDSYDAERRPVGAQVIRAAGRLTQVATVEGPHGQRLRNFFAHALLGLAPVQRAMAAQMTELSIGYPDSPLNGPDAGGLVKPGMRMEPLPDEKPYGAGDMPRFCLRGESSAAQHLMDRYPRLLDPALRLGAEEAGVQLVRPDGYLAMAVSRGHEERIDKYLEGFACA